MWKERRCEKKVSREDPALREFCYKAGGGAGVGTERRRDCWKRCRTREGFLFSFSSFLFLKDGKIQHIGAVRTLRVGKAGHGSKAG